MPFGTWIKNIHTSDQPPEKSITTMVGESLMIELDYKTRELEELRREQEEVNYVYYTGMYGGRPKSHFNVLNYILLFPLFLLLLEPKSPLSIPNAPTKIPIHALM